MANADKIFINGLTLDLSVGIYDQEKQAKQRVIIHAAFEVNYHPQKPLKVISDVVSYEKALELIKSIAQSRHFDLLEELAEEIAQKAQFDNKITGLTLRLEKPDIFKETESVGIEISRTFTS